jgi:hypothetical protein
MRRRSSFGREKRQKDKKYCINGVKENNGKVRNYIKNIRSKFLSIQGGRKGLL